MNARLSPEDLRRFVGGEVRYRHGLNRRIIYTEGVKHVADAGQAYWLIDDIAILVTSPEMRQAAEANSNLRVMQFWTLTVSKQGTAELSCDDGNGLSAGVGMTYGFTDFPLPKIDIWAALYGEEWTLYLPSEH